MSSKPTSTNVATLLNGSDGSHQSFQWYEKYPTETYALHVSEVLLAKAHVRIARWQSTPSDTCSQSTPSKQRATMFP